MQRAACAIAEVAVLSGSRAVLSRKSRCYPAVSQCYRGSRAVLSRKSRCYPAVELRDNQMLAKRFPMEWYHKAHLALTLVLSVAVTVFLVLLLTGVIEVRKRSTGTAAEPDRSIPPGGAKARLLVLRGLRPNWEYRLFEGRNVIGRADRQPVDIDLQPQEPEERVWSSRQHAAITCDGGSMVIEDLSTANGTYLNGTIVPPGTKRPLKAGDVIQIGEVQLKVLDPSQPNARANQLLQQTGAAITVFPTTRYSGGPGC